MTDDQLSLLDLPAARTARDEGIARMTPVRPARGTTHDPHLDPDPAVGRAAARQRMSEARCTVMRTAAGGAHHG